MALFGGGEPSAPFSAQFDIENFGLGRHSIRAHIGGYCPEPMHPCSWDSYSALSRSPSFSYRRPSSYAAGANMMHGTPDSGGAEDSGSAPPATEDVAVYPAIQVSRRFLQMALMLWGVTAMLMLRSVPAFVMQGTPSQGTSGMGDAGQVYDRPFTNAEKGAILAAWGWGYTLAQIPGGTAAQRLGGKRTLAFGALSAAALALIPTAGRAGGAGLVALLNFVAGVGQGPLFPALCGLQGRRLPPREFSRAHAILESMFFGGQALAKLIAPAVVLHLGWGWCYRCFVWACAAHSAPADDPRCSAAERAYIGQRRPAPGVAPGGGFGARAHWVVARQTPVLALTLAHVLLGVGSSWYQWAPLYVEQQKGFDLRRAGVWLALADYGAVAGHIAGGFFADHLRNARRFQGSRYADVNWIRRTSMVRSRALGGGMCFVFLLDALLGGSPWLLVMLVCVYYVTREFVSAWSVSLCQDLSYKYAAAIMGVANAGSNLTYYALSANIIGPVLDWGGCTATPTAGRQPDVFWEVAAGATCRIDDALPAGGNYTCISTASAAEQECTLRHTLRSVDVTKAVEDPVRCHATWQALFLAMGVASLAGAAVFYLFGSGWDITAKLDQEISAAHQGQEEPAAGQGAAPSPTDDASVTLSVPTGRLDKASLVPAAAVVEASPRLCPLCCK